MATAAASAGTANGSAISLIYEAGLLVRAATRGDGFRGEDVTLAPPGEAMPFTVRVAEPMGSHLLLTGRIGDAVVRVVAPPASPVKAGETVGLRLDPDRVVFMDAATGAATDLAA